MGPVLVSAWLPGDLSEQEPVEGRLRAGHRACDEPARQALRGRRQVRRRRAGAGGEIGEPVQAVLDRRLLLQQLIGHGRCPEELAQQRIQNLDDFRIELVVERHHRLELLRIVLERHQHAGDGDEGERLTLGGIAGKGLQQSRELAGRGDGVRLRLIGTDEGLPVMGELVQLLKAVGHRLLGAGDLGDRDLLVRAEEGRAGAHQLFLMPARVQELERDGPAALEERPAGAPDHLARNLSRQRLQRVAACGLDHRIFCQRNIGHGPLSPVPMLAATAAEATLDISIFVDG